MKGPLVTLGVPVYRGHEMLPVTLECLRTQTYPHLDVLISVDAADAASAEAARPFLADPRFRMHVQPSRLGWAGNTAWTMRERRGAFFIYQQHDDQVSPTYVADLVQAASHWPQAAICYAQMTVSGVQSFVVRNKPVTGAPLARALTHLERLDTGMLRGLIRGSALDATSGLLVNEFEGFGSEHRFMAELALAGEFRLVEGPTYYKRLHGENLHLKWYHWPEERKRAAWACLAAWMVEVIVPAGDCVPSRWRLLETVLDRFVVARGWLRRMGGRPAWYADPGQKGGAAVLRSLVGWARRSGRFDAWLREQRRWMYCRIDNDDLTARAALLRSVVDRLRSGGRFDNEAALQATWDEVERRIVNRFGVALR
jgi:glycosyltransferase involved in cell wall biosynthesis